MEFTNKKIYLNENILYKIYKYLPLNDKFKFKLINKLTYIEYNNHNKKLINNYYHDYKEFKECLNKNNYTKNEILDIGNKCIKYIDKVAEERSGSFQTYGINFVMSQFNFYYDLRYIFEIIMKEIDINKLIIKQEILKEAVKTIKKRKYLSRSETLWKISNEPGLRSLHWNFKPKNSDEWVYVK